MAYVVPSGAARKPVYTHYWLNDPVAEARKQEELDRAMALANAEMQALVDAIAWAEELNAAWTAEKVAIQAKVDAARKRNAHKLPLIDIGAKASLLESMRLAGIGAKRI